MTTPKVTAFIPKSSMTGKSIGASIIMAGIGSIRLPTINKNTFTIKNNSILLTFML